METLTAEAPATPAIYQQIPLDQIVPSPHQARKEFDPAALQTLADSMKLEGLIQPIAVRSVNSHFELVSGERRYRAAKLLGWEAIEAKVIQTVSEAEAAAKGLVENLQRADLNPIEEAEGFQILNQLDPGYWDQPKIAGISGRSQGYISQSLNILSLPEPIKQDISRLILSRSHALELLKLPTPEDQIKAAKEVISKDLSRGETRKLVDGLLKPASPTTPKQSEAKAKAADLSPGVPFTFKLEGPDVVGTLRLPKTISPDQAASMFKIALGGWLAVNGDPTTLQDQPTKDPGGEN